MDPWQVWRNAFEAQRYDHLMGSGTLVDTPGTSRKVQFWLADGPGQPGDPYAGRSIRVFLEGGSPAWVRMLVKPQPGGLKIWYRRAGEAAQDKTALYVENDTLEGSQMRQGDLVPVAPDTQRYVATDGGGVLSIAKRAPQPNTWLRCRITLTQFQGTQVEQRVEQYDVNNGLMRSITYADWTTLPNGKLFAATRTFDGSAARAVLNIEKVDAATPLPSDRFVTPLEKD